GGQELSWYELMAVWGSVAGAVFAFGALVVPLYLRWRDSKTRLRITYSIGEPEYPADLRDIPPNERPAEPAFYIKIFNKSKFNVRLNNVFIEDPRGPITFEQLGNLKSTLDTKTPGDHWILYQPLSFLMNTLKGVGYSGNTSFMLVVRDNTGKLHKKKVNIQLPSS
ncbi:MAG: hypothetical protein CYG60_15935, partial [Actinobacteria bacterium]